MKGKSGSTYCQISNGRAHWIFTADDLPEWNEQDILAVDVTEDVPKIGDVWNGSAWVPAPLPVPEVVTMRQARLALLQSNLLAQVNTAVASADEATRITWEFSQEVQRGNPLVATLAAVLNLTDAQLDDLFRLAVTL